MKEICIVTNYFPPETGAASNRISFLATLLAKKGYNVTVLCPLPNYPKGQIFKGYRRSFFRKEAQATISVHRLWLYATNSTNKWKRLFSMLSFSVSLLFYRCFKKAVTDVFVIGNRVTMNLELCKTKKPPKIHVFRLFSNENH